MSGGPLRAVVVDTGQSRRRPAGDAAPIRRSRTSTHSSPVSWRCPRPPAASTSSACRSSARGEIEDEATFAAVDRFCRIADVIAKLRDGGRRRWHADDADPPQAPDRDARAVRRRAPPPRGRGLLRPRQLRPARDLLRRRQRAATPRTHVHAVYGDRVDDLAAACPALEMVRHATGVSYGIGAVTGLVPRSRRRRRSVSEATRPTSTRRSTRAQRREPDRRARRGRVGGAQPQGLPGDAAAAGRPRRARRHRGTGDGPAHLG